MELSKRGYRHGWFVSTDDIRTLLEGIRRDYPELEARFDPQRIGAWEAKLYPGTLDRGGFQDVLSQRNLGIVLALGALRMAFAYRHLLFDHPEPPPPPAVVATPDANLIALDSVTRHWFGPGTDFAALGRLAPQVGRLAAANAGGTTDPAAADQAMRNAVFEALALAVPHVDAVRLRAVQRVRADAMDVVAKADPAACVDFQKHALIDATIALPDPVGAAAVEQVRAIAATGLFGNDARIYPRKAASPGTVFGAVMAKTGLSENAVVTALHHDGPDSAQCAVHRALIRQALHLAGPAGDAILRIE
jgi:hypothetical protein